MNNDFLTFLGFFIIFFATTLGSAFVFFLKNNISKKFNCLLLGISGGIMVAASIWSLLLPAIEESSVYYNTLNFIPVSIGFLLGGIFLVVLDKIILHFNIKNSRKSTFFLSKPFKLFVAITIHNIPEGLAVGFAFGGAYLIGQSDAFVTALGLAIGIAIQNLPEGAAVSLPLRNETKSRGKAFILGFLSGVVEPISAVIGLLLSASLICAQPWFLAFSAGAMIYVVIKEIMPDTKLNSFDYLGPWGFMIGFVIMMILDVAI